MNMTKYFLIALILLSYLVSAEYQLVWSDEFDGDSLDLSNWDVEVNCWGGGNFEKQCYTNRPDNIQVSDGILRLIAKKETYQGQNEGCTDNRENSCTWTHPTTSGRIRTLRSMKGSFVFGKFEARMKLPKGNFLWPAFWMLPTDAYYGTWALSGEIDIMEARSQKPNFVAHTIHHSDVWPRNLYTSSGELDMGFDCTDDFHVYGVEWTPENMIWYVDDKQTFSLPLKKSWGENYDHDGAPFDRPFHIIFNLAVGGNFFDPSVYGVFDADRDTTSWVSPVLEIDYVRVYQDPNYMLEECRTCSSSNNPSPNSNPDVSPDPNSNPDVDSNSQGSIPEVNQYDMGTVDRREIDFDRGVLWSIPIYPVVSWYYPGSNRNEHYPQIPMSMDHGNIVYMRFYLPSSMPSSLGNCILVFNSGLQHEGIVTLYTMPDNSWNEENVNLDSGFTMNEIQSFNVLVNSNNMVHSFDVSEYVRNAIGNNNNMANTISFAIVVQSNHPIDMRSLHSMMRLKPYILMKFN